VGGATVYRVMAGGNSSALTAPAKTVLVFSDLPDAQLAPVLKSKGSAVTGDLGTMVTAASKGTIYLAAALDGTTRQQMQGMAGRMGGAGGAMQSAKAVGAWVTFGSADVEVKIALLMPDAAAAGKAVADLQAEAQKQSAGQNLQNAVMMAMLPAAVK